MPASAHTCCFRRPSAPQRTAQVPRPDPARSHHCLAAATCEAGEHSRAAVDGEGEGESPRAWGAVAAVTGTRSAGATRTAERTDRRQLHDSGAAQQRDVLNFRDGEAIASGDPVEALM